MPWKERTAMSERAEFVKEAKRENSNITALCQEYGISRTTGYKWIRRYNTLGEEGLDNRSRRPNNSPNKTPLEIETIILETRTRHPSWGGVKILAYLKRQGCLNLPVPSTATMILKRNNMIDPQESCKHVPMQRFEKASPNELWQMDFKGYFRLDQGHCHPLTILDDHSRFLLGLHACPNQLWETVQCYLTYTFRTYGLPDRMLMDNGSPWGDDRHSPHTVLTAWLMRLGIPVSHGRPYHPQTQGKDERLHRTFQTEVLNQTSFHTLSDCQFQFDTWRDFYNHERPHQALQHSVPAEHYHPSNRPFPEILPPVLYELGDVVRMVDQAGRISFYNHAFRIGKAFRYFPVALRPTDIDGTYNVYFCSFKVTQIDIRDDHS
jgi:transposase InsO family protein